MTQRFAQLLVDWQRRCGRSSLPWQAYDGVYERWLSEIMLQQTQVETVKGYFLRFIERFPTVQALAEAKEDDVLALWAGLGYYSRARNLHKAARLVVHQLGGRFPDTAEGLAQLPGVGPSTAGAVAAFCFGERAVMCDGNAKRVLARLFAEPGRLGDRDFERRVWARAEALLPEEALMADYTQGLMDLGATCCTRRRPACDRCPAVPLCRAYRTGLPEAYPAPKARKERPHKALRLHFLFRDDALWLKRRDEAGVWRGLWLPYACEDGETPDGVTVLASETLERFAHDFTHYRLWITPVVSVVRGDGPHGGRWTRTSERAALGVPAPVAELLPVVERLARSLSLKASACD